MKSGGTPVPGHISFMTRSCKWRILESFKKMIHSNRQYTNVYTTVYKSCTWTLRFEHLDIGYSDASQNYEKMGTEFILPLLGGILFWDKKREIISKK
jgi:hypothetical protein